MFFVVSFFWWSAWRGGTRPYQSRGVHNEARSVMGFTVNVCIESFGTFIGCGTECIYCLHCCSLFCTVFAP